MKGSGFNLRKQVTFAQQTLENAVHISVQLRSHPRFTWEHGDLVT